MFRKRVHLFVFQLTVVERVLERFMGLKTNVWVFLGGWWFFDRLTNTDVFAFSSCSIDDRQSDLGLGVVEEGMESEGDTSEAFPACVDDFGVKWL